MKRLIPLFFLLGACGAPVPDDVVYEEPEPVAELTEDAALDTGEDGAAEEEVDIVAESDAAAAEQVLVSCGADQFQDLLGQPLADALAILPQDNLQVLSVGGLSTTDYRPLRMNVLTDEKDRITRIWCG